MPRELTLDDVGAYLARHEQKELLRFVTVGSVDDGKSTLIGRLLHDTHGIYDDQLAAVERASKTRGSTGGKLDLSLLTDGLRAEREQGITIDVAYRYFSTDKRKFIIADTPGHIQYTRNMATGASTANVAVILIDARLGVLQQSRRHAYIASLLGIPHLAVCVNKMDLVGFDRAVYDAIVADFARVSATLGFREVAFFPISAVDGDNIVSPSARAPWHDGGTLLAYLESVPIDADRNVELFRFPVQYVMRPDLHYRGFCGQIASGAVRTGDEVMVLPSRRRSRVLAIDAYHTALDEAFAPMSVTLRLADEIDVSRGEMLVHPDQPPRESRRFEAQVVWMSETPLDEARSYYLKHTTRVVRAQVDQVLGRLDLERLAEEPAARLELNDIGRLAISASVPLFFDPYEDNRPTGAFILIDGLTNNTVGAGMILRGLDHEGREGPRSQRISLVPDTSRRARSGHGGAAVLFTGRAPKQADLAFGLERELFDRGLHTTIIDVEALSSAQRSPLLFADMADACVRGGLITILSTALPRALAADELALRLGSRLIRLETPVGATAQELAEVVMKALADLGLHDV
jgi:bifunctional enzyme CysN/CysC